MDRKDIIKICNEIRYGDKRLPYRKTREFFDILMEEAKIDFSVIGIENKGFIYAEDIMSDKELNLIVDTISKLCCKGRNPIIRIIAKETKNTYKYYRNKNGGNKVV